MSAGMEHAIERAARIIHTGHCCPCDPRGCDEPDPADYNAARALAEAGLLAPAPFREEWETTFPNGRRRPGKDMPQDSWWKGDPLEGRNVRRYVTAWEVER